MSMNITTPALIKGITSSSLILYIAGSSDSPTLLCLTFTAYNDQEDDCLPHTHFQYPMHLEVTN